GPDPLGPGFGVSELAAILAGSRQKLKGLLRDQSVLAGVGNAYSDEVLQAAKLSPFRLGSSQSAAEVEGLYEALQSVLRDAVARDVDPSTLGAGGGPRPAGQCGPARRGLPVVARWRPAEGIHHRAGEGRYRAKAAEADAEEHHGRGRQGRPAAPRDRRAGRER